MKIVLLILVLFSELACAVAEPVHAFKFEKYYYILKNSPCKLNIKQASGMLEYYDNFPIKTTGCWKEDKGKIYTLIYYPARLGSNAELRSQYSNYSLYKPAILDGNNIRFIK